MISVNRNIPPRKRRVHSSGGGGGGGGASYLLERTISIAPQGTGMYGWGAEGAQPNAVDLNGQPIRTEGTRVTQNNRIEVLWYLSLAKLANAAFGASFTDDDLFAQGAGGTWQMKNNRVMLLGVGGCLTPEATGTSSAAGRMFELLNVNARLDVLGYHVNDGTTDYGVLGSSPGVRLSETLRATAATWFSDTHPIERIDINLGLLTDDPSAACPVETTIRTGSSVLALMLDPVLP